MSTLHEQNPQSGSQTTSKQGTPQTPSKDKDAIAEKVPLQQNPAKDAPRTPMSAAKDSSEGLKQQQQQPSSGEKR